MLTENCRKTITSAMANYSPKPITTDRENNTQNSKNVSLSYFVSNFTSRNYKLSQLEAHAEAYYYEWGAFAIGTGDNQNEQIKLTNMIDDSLYTLGNRSSVLDQTTGKVTLTQVMTYNGTESVDIKEVGLFWVIQNQNYGTMMAREVLDNPITVNQGDTFTVSMVIG